MLSSGTPLTPWSHQRDASLKLQEGHQVATDPGGQHHGRHQSRRQSIRPINRVHQGKHQRALPPSRRDHGSTHGAGGSRHHLPGGEVAELHNDPLPPHNSEEFHRRPLREYVRAWRLHTHSAGSCRQLVPSGTQGPSRTLLQGVSGGMVQYQCGLDDINIAFLSHT